MRPEFWSTNLAFPSFLAIRPLRNGEFVICKMKVAALERHCPRVDFGFWIRCYLRFRCVAMRRQLKGVFYLFRMMYPHSWLVIIILSAAGVMVLTWRCLVVGLWTGLSGNTLRYIGSICGQGVIAVLLLIACGIWSDTIDSQIKNHPDVVKSVAISFIGWTLAALVILKLWLAVFAWSKITPDRSRQYLIIWSCVTLGFVLLGILATPLADTYRCEHLFVLAALLLMPFARLGLAPSSLAKNRHR